MTKSTTIKKKKKHIAWLGHNDKNEMNEMQIKDSKIIAFYHKSKSSNFRSFKLLELKLTIQNRILSAFVYLSK